MGNIIHIPGRNQPAHLRAAGLSVIEAVNSREMFSLLRAGRPVAVVLGALKPEAIAALQREFPRVKLLLGRANSAPVPLHGPPSVRRPYDPQEVEDAAKTLMSRPKARR